MSIFWNSQELKPRAWVRFFFVALTCIFAVSIYFYGIDRADKQEAHSSNKYKLAD